MFRFMLAGFVAATLIFSTDAAKATDRSTDLAPQAQSPVPATGIAGTSMLAPERITASMVRRFSAQTPTRTTAVSRPAFANGRLIGSAGLRFNNGSTILTAQVERGVSDEISLGARLNFTSSDGITAFTIGGVGAYHLGQVLKVNNQALDPFVGLYVALPVATGYGETQSGKVFGHLLLGSRYFLNDRFGLMGQLNMGLIRSRGTSVELGVSYAFN